MSVELTVPAVGESITEVFINQWMKAEGDYAEKDETIAELETDKATFEFPAPVSGIVTKIAVGEGESAQVGQSIGTMEAGEAPAGGTPDVAPPPSKEDAPKAETAPTGDGGSDRVMPAAAAALAQHGLTADQVQATGPGGRLLKEDVIRHTEKSAAPAKTPAAPLPTSGGEGDREEDLVPMSPMRQTIAKRLVSAQHNAALLTTFNEVDMSGIMDLRSQFKDAFVKKYDVKLGFMSFFVKAVVDGLKQCPALNAEIREETKIAYRNYYDIGIAVSSKKGLVVPVIRNTERLSFAEVEGAIVDFGTRAQQNKIKLEELEGGTFTITNGGVFGSLLSTPIINPPQSGVLGMHGIQQRPIAVDGQVVIRPMMYIALTYDHRVVDGREAVTFLKRVKESCEQPARMLMEI